MANPTFSVFAGVRNTLQPERLHSLPTRDNPTCDLVHAVNVDIDNSGQVARRAGQTLQVAGATHSLWAQGADCFCVQGRTLYRLLPDMTLLPLAAGLTPDAPLSYVGINGRTYWSNGFQNGVIDGRCRSWGMELPDAPGVQAIAGQLGAGLYQALVTFGRDDGQESGAGLPSQLTLAGNAGVRVSWAVPEDTALTEAHVYLSEPNGMVLYQAAVVDAAAGLADLTSAQLALPLATQWMDKPPAGQALAYHRGRIFIAQGAFLFGTTALGYEYVDLRDFLALDGTRIAFVIGVEHGLFVGTAQAVYLVAGDRLEEFSPRIVVDGAGLAGSAVHVDGFVATGKRELAGQQCALFTTALGVCMGLPDGSVQHLTQERYQFDTLGAVGAAGFRSGRTLSQYLLFLQR